MFWVSLGVLCGGVFVLYVVFIVVLVVCFMWVGRVYSPSFLVEARLVVFGFACELPVFGLGVVCSAGVVFVVGFLGLWILCGLV